jgi:hypothetical protein
MDFCRMSQQRISVLRRLPKCSTFLRACVAPQGSRSADVISHNMEVVRAFADRIAVLRHNGGFHPYATPNAGNNSVARRANPAGPNKLKLKMSDGVNTGKPFA